MLTYTAGKNNRLNLRLSLNSTMQGLYVECCNELLLTGDFINCFSYVPKNTFITPKIDQEIAKQVFEIFISGILC